jgi:hypothetical protein
MHQQVAARNHQETLAADAEPLLAQALKRRFHLLDCNPGLSAARGRALGLGQLVL